LSLNHAVGEMFLFYPGAHLSGLSSIAGITGCPENWHISQSKLKFYGFIGDIINISEFLRLFLSSGLQLLRISIRFVAVTVYGQKHIKSG
jgi:hypothetical protein